MAKARLTLKQQGVHDMEFFPVCNMKTREIAENASNSQEAFEGQDTSVLEGNEVLFMFGNPDSGFELEVNEWDDEYCEKGDEIMYVEDAAIACNILSPDYLEEGNQLPSNLVPSSLNSHFMASYLSSALKDMIDRVIKPHDFILEVMRRGLMAASTYYTLSDEDEAEKKPHYGVVRASHLEEETFSISYTIELDDEGDFDPDALQLVCIDQQTKGISPTIGNMLYQGFPLLNVLLYKGKAYFAGYDDYMENGGWVQPKESSFDIINMDLSSRSAEDNKEKRITIIDALKNFKVTNVDNGVILIDTKDNEEQYNQFIHNLKAYWFGDWNKLSDFEVTPEILKGLKDENLYDLCDDVIADDLPGALLNVAWLTYRDYDYEIIEENEEYDDLYDDCYKYAFYFGDFNFKYYVEKDIDMT